MKTPGVCLMLSALTACTHAGPPPPAPVEIVTSDVSRFYGIYDAAQGSPSAEVLQRDYIDAGSAGVRQFVPNRIISGEALAARIAKDRSTYDRARACASALPGAKRRLGAAFAKLATLYPPAQFPPVTVLIGRDNSGGTAGDAGVLVGLEVVCRPDAPQQGTVEDNLVYLIAHEYAHVQQPSDEGAAGAGTLLRQSLKEGVAELVAELIAGRIASEHLPRWTRGREKELETAFLADAGGNDMKKWIYNGVGTPEQPGDLGYWIGYRIAKSYYRRSSNKAQALRDLIELRDPKAILAGSGWHPGIDLSR
jgi:hypothetical protein